MDRISIRTWTLVGIIGLALFVGYFLRLQMKRSGWGYQAGTFTYEMPRPKNFEPRFDLSDFEIERKLKTLPALPEAKRPLATTPAAKKEDDKKKAQLEAKKKADAAKKQAEARRKKAQIQIVDTSRASRLDVALADTAVAMPVMAFGGAMAKAAAPKNPTEVEQEEDRDQALERSPSQWRSLLQTSPTAKNIADFMKARQAGKIESSAYYSIVHALLVDSGDDRRKAALTILDQDVSATSFVFMINELGAAPQDIKAEVQKRANSYSEVSKLGYMNRVLATSQETVVLDAGLDRISAAWSLFKAQGDNRAPSSVSGYKLSQFTVMLSTLKKIGSHKNVGAKATALASEIAGQMAQELGHSNGSKL